MSTIHRCSTCSKEAYEMKWCGKCKLTLYCSRECQTSDWKQHKKTCVPAIVTEGASSVKSKTASGNKSKAASGNKSKAASGNKSNRKPGTSSLTYHVFDHITGQLRTTDVDLIRPVDCPQVELLPMELQFLAGKVKSSLASYSNFFRIPSKQELRFTTDFGQLKSDREPDCDPVWTSSSVLLAKIVELDVYQYRHGIIISDEKYRRVVVYFHHDTPPWPSFKWDHLTPGNFICIRGPRLHWFCDGQTGFRVDDPHTVRILSQQGKCLSGKR